MSITREEFGPRARDYADSFGVTPDMMTMAKALTNGCVPMGAVGGIQAISEFQKYRLLAIQS